MVTAFGESALAVLQEKLPTQIRPLSIALLTNEQEGKRQFEYSIQEIANRVNNLDANQSSKTILSLEEQLNSLHAKISAVDQTINNFAEKHMKQQSFQGNEILPAELAKFVLEREEDYCWLEDEINSKVNTLNFTDNDIKLLRIARSTVGNDLYNIEHSFPVSDEFPEWLVLGNLHNDLIRARQFKEKISAGTVLPLLNTTPEIFEQAKKLLEFIIQRQNLEEKLEREGIYWTNRLREIFLQPNQDPAINHLLSLCKEINTLDIIRKANLANAVSMPDDLELNESFILAIQRLSQGKSAFKLFGSKNIKQHLANITVTSLNPKHDNQEAWQKVVNHTKFRLDARKILSQWNVIAHEMEMGAVNDELNISFRLVAKYASHIEELKRLVENFDSALTDNIAAVFGHTIFDTTQLSKEDIDAIKSSLTQHLDRDRFAYAQRQMTALVKNLDGHSGVIVDEIYTFLNHSLGDFRQDEYFLRDSWQSMMTELNRLNSFQPSFREIKRVSSLLAESGASKWARAIQSIPYNENEKMTSTSWLEAWNWRAAKTFLQQIDGHQKLKLLFDERRSLEKILSKTYQDLIAEKTWLGVYNNSPNDIRQALQARATSLKHLSQNLG